MGLNGPNGADTRMAYKLCKCDICKPGPNKVRISFTISQENLAFIKRKAEEQGISQNAVIRHFLVAGVVEAKKVMKTWEEGPNLNPSSD